MNLKIKYILPIFAFIPTQTYAFAPETPDEVTSVSADTVKIKGKGEVNIVENDSTFLREVFESDTFDKLIELDMATSEVHLIPDSVIIRRLRILDARSPFSLEFNPEVRKYINMYLGQRKALVARMVGLSLYYYDLFDNVLDRYGIPLELKHLVVIESAMNPKARSRVGASGLWQFMYGTGRMYNLYTDSYVDERFDPHKSTEAAAKMLKTLYDDYKDWNLALAAYNYGSGNVNKAIARSGGKRNFWEVRAYMPRNAEIRIGFHSGQLRNVILPRTQHNTRSAAYNIRPDRHDNRKKPRFVRHAGKKTRHACRGDTIPQPSLQTRRSAVHTDKTLFDSASGGQSVQIRINRTGEQHRRLKPPKPASKRRSATKPIPLPLQEGPYDTKYAAGTPSER